MPLNNRPASFDLQHDLTQAVRNIPIQYGWFNTSGIFTDEAVTSDVVRFVESTVDGALIVDRIRGEKNLTSKGNSKKVHSFNVPHFPLDDGISPKELQSQSAYDSISEVQTLEKVIAAKSFRMAQNHDWTLNKARAQALFLGTVYAPNGTVVQDWNSEFGHTRLGVDFTLGTAGTDVIAKIEEVIQYVQDGMGTSGSGSFTGIVAPVDTSFFNKLIKLDAVKTAYAFQQQTNSGTDPLRGRLSTGGNPMQMGREFYFAGITFKEIRDSYNGTKLVTANEGVAVPTGTDMFKTYFAPAERFGLVNTAGERMYMFTKQDDTQITLQTESNHCSALLRPQGVVRLFSSN